MEMEEQISFNNSIWLYQKSKGNAQQPLPHVKSGKEEESIFILGRRISSLYKLGTT